MLTISHNDLSLSYRKVGNGSRHILCFHGHGKDHKDFVAWKDFLSDYTIYSFDLFGHGRSEIPNHRIPDLPITPKEFITIFQIFFEQEKLNRVTLLGYSLGGKIALNLFQDLPQYVENIIMLAPDGLKEIGWYTKTSEIKWLQRLYQRTIDKPVWFFKFIRVLRFFRILPKGLYKFLQYQFSNKERRTNSFNTWAFYRKLFPNHDLLKNQFKNYSIPSVVVLGKYDKVIKSSFGPYFKHHVYPDLEIIELETGHDFFKPKNLSLTQSTLRKSNYL